MWHYFIKNFGDPLLMGKATWYVKVYCVHGKSGPWFDKGHAYQIWGPPFREFSVYQIGSVSLDYQAPFILHGGLMGDMDTVAGYAS